MRLRGLFDALESRNLLAAPSIAYVSASNNETGLFVVVDYTSDVGLNMATVGNGDLLATKSGQPSLTGNLFGTPTVQDNGSLRAIYLFQAPTGAWNFTDTGTYNITSPAGQVQDTNGDNLVSSAVHSLPLWFSQPKVAIPDTTIRTNDWLIVVNYTDNTGINASTIGASDISVEGPAIISGITLFQAPIINSPTSVTAVYRVPAPAGGWSHLNTGRYSIVFNHRAVADNTGVAPATHTIRSFDLGFNNPSARLQSTTVRSDDWLIPVRFAGRSSIDTSSITNNTVSVTSPNGYNQSGTVQSITPNGDGTVTALFRFTAKGGFWDYTDNAQYTLSIASNQVKDINNRFVNGGTYHTYSLWFNNPAAEVVDAFAIPDRFDLVIRFHDNTALNPDTLTASAISVAGPSLVNITLVTTVADPVRGVRAVFRITPTGAALANGQYTVRIVSNQVRDTAGTAMNAGILQTFGLHFN